MNKENKLNIYLAVEPEFETEEIKLYMRDMVQEIPDYIFTIPSSTTGKYHNPQQCEKFGQIYHIVMQSDIVDYRLSLEWYKEKFTEIERDMLRCIPWLHDAIKCGLNGSQYTLFNHPMLAGEFVRNTSVEHNIDDDMKNTLATLCESHSGQWNTSNRNKLVLPKPENELEFFAHECDYLSSRMDIGWTIPDGFKEVLEENTEIELPDINTYELNWGKKYPHGTLLKDVHAQDPGYVKWIAESEYAREPLKSMCKKLIESNKN